MKSAKYLVYLFVVMLFASCVDVEEKYDFYADGSCNVIYNMDMGKAISVLANLLPDSVKQSPQFSLVEDTTLNFYNALPDSIHQKMDSSQVAMAKSSDLIVRMNLGQDMLKVSILHSADNSAGLAYYLKNVGKMTSNEHLNSIIPDSKAMKDVSSGELLIEQDYYNYEITPHKFYRTIDTARFNRYIRKNESVFKMSKAVLIDMPYKLTLNFPYPVKAVNNKKAVISGDKKSVTLITNIEDAFKDPAIMNLKIDF